MAAYRNTVRYGEIVMICAVVGLLGNLFGVAPKEKTFDVSSQLPYRRFYNGTGENANDDSLQKIPDHHLTDGPESVSEFRQTWLTFENVWIPEDNMLSYRACVKRPEVADMQTTLTGDSVITERRDRMRIEDCLETCTHLTFTYAALSRGSECYCTNVTSTSRFLTYVGNIHCNLPCTGDPLHNCGGHQFMSVYRTSVPDDRCSAIELGSRGSFPLVALASFPRSGNTWSRQLIKKATGYFTTSYRMNFGKLMMTRNDGGNLDFKEGRNICIKTHKYNDSQIQDYEGAILIIRNPYRSIVSRAFRRKITTVDEEWERLVKRSIKDWEAMYTHWIQSGKRLQLVIYEELERDPVAQLTRMVEFLLNGAVDRERVMCATQDHPSLLLTSCNEGVHANGHVNGRKSYITVDPFTPKMRITIDESIRRVNRTIFKYRNVILPHEYLEAIDNY